MCELASLTVMSSRMLPFQQQKDQSTSSNHLKYMASWVKLTMYEIPRMPLKHDILGINKHLYFVRILLCWIECSACTLVLHYYFCRINVFTLRILLCSTFQVARWCAISTRKLSWQNLTVECLVSSKMNKPASYWLQVIGFGEINCSNRTVQISHFACLCFYNLINIWLHSKYLNVCKKKKKNICLGWVQAFSEQRCLFWNCSNWH